MVSESDLIKIPFNPDMTVAGIKYACRSATDVRNQSESRSINGLRKTIANNIVKLGLKRHLDKTNIPYEMIRSAPISDPDQFDIFIGGRRCDIHVILISDKRRIRLTRAEPNLLLKAQASLPSGQRSDTEFFEEDILIFIFLTALMTPNRRTIEKANEAGQPLYMVNMLPSNWTIPAKWVSLGTILVESNQETTIQLEFGGCNIHRQIQTERFVLKPHSQMDLKQNFYTLSYIHTPNLPDNTIRVHSSFLKETYLVEPYAWNNLWIYGMDIIIGGYITRAEYQKNASLISKIGQNEHTMCASPKNRSLPIQSLYPINDLFERAQSWSQL
jgi:hypothetical protein